MVLDSECQRSFLLNVLENGVSWKGTYRENKSIMRNFESTINAIRNAIIEKSENAECPEWDLKTIREDIEQ